MTKIFARFMKDESGATAIEYGLIAALISVALITGATSLGTSLNQEFTDLSKTMDTGVKQ
jgi:pilus assembly protein Flp/PilA